MLNFGQVACGNVHYYRADPLGRSELADSDSKFQKLFVMWKGMKAIHDRLNSILDKSTKEFSMDIEKCEEETYFEREDFVYKIGKGHAVERPSKWQDLFSLDRYNKVNEDVDLEYKALKETVERIAQTLQHKRKTRQHLLYCHQKWKGLVLMHYVFTKQENMMFQFESSFIQPTEEETYIEDETYIMNYAEAHPEAKGSNNLELLPIVSENALNGTLEKLEPACRNLTKGNRQMVQNMSSIRKRIAGIDLQRHLQEEQNLRDEIKKLEEERQNLEKVMKENHNSEQFMEIYNKEKQQWEEEKRHLESECNRLIAEMVEECKKLKENNANLQDAYRHKQQELDQERQLNALEIEKRNKDIKLFQQKLAKHKQHIKELESLNVIAQKKENTLEAEKEKLLTRLSKIAGTKLTQGNAAITDLSDADRPMKIAEKYSELYDNEWTDGLEELLDKGATDDLGIQILLQIVIEAFEFCSNAAQKYQEGMVQSATCLPNLSSLQGATTDTTQNVSHLQGQCPSLEAKSSQEYVQLTDEQKQALDDLRKALSPQLLSQVQKQYDDRLNAILQSHFGGKNYSFTPQRSVNSDAEPDVSYHRRSKNKKKGNEIRAKSEGESLENRADHPSTFDDGTQQRTNYFNTLSQRRQPADNLCEADSGPGESNQFSSHQYSNVQEYAITTTKDHQFEEEETRITSSFEKTKGFAKKCVHLCWLMGIKDPPLAMIFNVPTGSKMNTDWFKHYTQSGNLIKFLVWPALFLHKDGALLAKGVAQPMSKLKNNLTYVQMYNAIEMAWSVHSELWGIFQNLSHLYEILNDSLIVFRNWKMSQLIKISALYLTMIFDHLAATTVNKLIFNKQTEVIKNNKSSNHIYIAIVIQFCFNA